jgi:hypothetical protein
VGGDGARVMQSRESFMKMNDHLDWTVGLCLWQAMVYGLASVKEHAE